MTEYEVAVDNRLFTIKFTTDNQESAERVRDLCKELVENDRPVQKLKPCPYGGNCKCIGHVENLAKIDAAPLWDSSTAYQPGDKVMYHGKEIIIGNRYHGKEIIIGKTGEIET